MSFPFKEPGPYRTECGSKVYIIGVNPVTGNWIGVFESGVLGVWNADGTSMAHAITGKWIDPPTCRQVCEELVTQFKGRVVPNELLSIVQRAEEALKGET